MKKTPSCKGFFLVVGIMLMAFWFNYGVVTGAILLSDDFEDGNSSGWSTSGGSWSVVTDGTKVYKQSSTSASAYSYNGTASWTDYSVQARVKALSFNGTSRSFGITARYQSTSNFYYLTLSNANQLLLGKKASGGSVALASKSLAVQTGTWYTLKLVVSGSQLQAYLDGVLQLTATDTSLTAGKGGLIALYTSAEFDDLLIDGINPSVTPTPTPTLTITPPPTVTSNTPKPTATMIVTPTPTPTPTTTIPVNGTIVVAKDGSGNYTTIQAAIDGIPANNSAWKTVIVKNGTYNEHVFIAKSYVALIGESRENTKIEFLLNRATWNSEMGVTNTGSGVVNLGCTAPDPSTKGMTKVDTADVFIGNMTIANTAPTGTGTVYTHVIRGESTATRISVVSCNLNATGSDTLALWNTTTGMYYHNNCTYKGSIDAVCPRGWCYDVGSTYIEVGNSAPIWHEGATGSGQKFVIRNAYVMPDVPKNFKLLNGQKESTVYLLDSYFYNSGGKTISEGSVAAAYYYNCHMEGGDQSWHANNLSSAPGSPDPSQITAKWTFNDQWDPENTLPAVLPYASIPQPWDKASEVPVTTQLRWVKAKDAYSYNVYFGTTNTPSYAGNTTGNTFNPGQLTKGTTYYWRIDALTVNGTITGTLWSFTITN